MDINKYEIIKRKYGKVASWLIYDEDYSDYKIIEKHIHELNPAYVFCGLNAAKDTLGIWQAFHLRYQGGKGKILKETFNDSPVFRGAYITDLFKEHVNAKSNEVFGIVKKDENFRNKYFNIYCEEMEYLKIGGKYPKVYTIGGATSYFFERYDVLRKFNATPIPHYSAYGLGTGKFQQTIRKIEHDISNRL